VLRARAPGLADLAVLEQECIRKGLPRPGPPGLGARERREWRAVAWLRRDRSGGKPKPGRLERLAAAVQAGAAKEVVVVPVSVFWGRSPDKEGSSSSCCSPRTGASSGGCASCS
jgi:glycerol-3-phosphate O-acyltransferase